MRSIFTRRYERLWIRNGRASSFFSGKPLDTNMVLCCTEKLCGGTDTAPQGAHPLYRLSTASKRNIYQSEKRKLLDKQHNWTITSGRSGFSSVTTIERKRQLTSVALPGQRYVKAMVPPAVSLRRPQGLGGAQLPLGQSCWLANTAPSATDRIFAQPMSG